MKLTALDRHEAYAVYCEPHPDSACCTGFATKLLRSMSMEFSGRIPHPFPYQGSKRAIAPHILSFIPKDVGTLHEPFCGAAAVSIAAAARGLASRFRLNDLNSPLIDLWTEILERPRDLTDSYETLWKEQAADRKAYFFAVRKEFNRTHQAHHLLYLLARIVKGAVRYSSTGEFNQSADNRRSGMNPRGMHKQITGVCGLLGGKTCVTSLDFREALRSATTNDLVYMDPPYQGTSFTRDHRYFGGLTYDTFAEALDELNQRHISYIVSYDGYTGDKVYGKALPQELRLKHLEVRAGRSAQSTLLGLKHDTVESLYLSAALVKRLASVQREPETRRQAQLAFA